MRTSFITAVIFSTVATSSFADSLIDIYSLAQARDPVILQSKAQRDSAYEAINETNAANLPQINLKGTAQYQKTNRDDLNTAFVAGGQISLQQSIWRHSNFINSSISEKLATKQDLDYNDAKQNLILRTSTAYIGVLEYEKANQAALKRQLDESNQRFKVGLIANTDVQEAKAAYDQASAQVIVAENNLENSYENLRQITGLEHKKLDKLDVSKFATPGIKKDSNFWLKQAEENNISLQAKMVEKEIAKEKISLARTGYEPTLDLIGGLSSQYTNYKENNASKEDGTLNSGSIGVEFNMPLYSGGATNSAVEQEKLNYIAASESLELSHRTVKTNLYNQYNNINASIGTVKAYQQSVVSAQSALEATEAGYQVGTRTIVD